MRSRRGERNRGGEGSPREDARLGGDRIGKQWKSARVEERQREERQLKERQRESGTVKYTDAPEIYEFTTSSVPLDILGANMIYHAA